MRTNLRARSIGIVVLLSALLVAAPVAAEPGNPVLDYLQTTLKPLLDSIQTGVNALQSSVATLQTGVTSLQASATAIINRVIAVQNTVAKQPSLHIVKTRFTTQPNSTTGFNLDLESVPQGSFYNVKKYSVTFLVYSSFAGAPVGMDRIRLVDGVLEGNATLDVDIVNIDPAVSGGAFALQPYVGSNSFFSVSRGNDGLGPIDILVNAYIESEP